MKNLSLFVLFVFCLLSCGPKSTPSTSDSNPPANEIQDSEKTKKGVNPKPIENLTGKLEEQLAHEEPEFHITYISPNQKLYIVENRMSHFIFKQEYPENSPTATPTATTTETVLKNILIDLQEIETLQYTIRDHFMSLPEASGATEEDRHYPYTIKVQMDKEYHEVVFRSNPSFEKAPEGFKTVEKTLLDISKKLQNR